MPRTIPVLVFTLVASFWSGACLDLSALDEGFATPAGPSPYYDPTAAAGDDVVVPELDVTLPDNTLDIDFDALEPFSLAAVVPGEGDILGGEVVMLVGTGFHDHMEVFFGEAKASDPFVVDSHYLTVESPSHWPGPVDVKVVGSGDEVAILEQAFTYTAPLVVERIEPDIGSAAGGLPVVVTGTGFDDSCRLFLGGRQATSGVLLDPFSFQAVSPAGHCGAVDVSMVCTAGTGTLKDGFFYDGLPAVDAAWPKVVPVEGGIEVTLEGRNFTPHMTIAVDDEIVPEVAQEFLAPSLVRFLLPAGEVGPATLALTTACGSTEFPGTFIYNDAEAGTGPAIVGVSPQALPACAGGVVTLAVSQMGDPDWLSVLVDGSAVDVIGLDEDQGILDVLVPPGAPGGQSMTLVTGDGSVTLDEAVELEDRPHLASVSPATGHFGGGTEVVLAGCALPDPAEVRFGAHVAIDLFPVTSEKIVATTPPGSPGPVNVTVVGAGSVASLPNGFSYLTDEPVIYLVEPDNGAVAGGTFVRFHGAGLPPNAKWFIGDRECFNVTSINSASVVARTPAGEVGTWPVTAKWAGGEATLADGYTYFDPMSKKGGTWGGAIDESLNVTVLDSSTGDGLPAAFVMVGSESATPHKGYTDEAGQVTFSQPGFEGPVQVTAAKPGYSLYSVVHFDAANVTVYLYPIKLPESGGASYTPAQSWVAGRVYGLDKYVVIPPGDCANKSEAGVLCAPCAGDEDCLAGDEGPAAYCASIGGGPGYCATECLAPQDCPDGYMCVKTGPEQTGCIPRGGEKAIRCESSKKSVFGSPPDPGPGAMVNEHNIYFINAVTGEFAVVCYGGYIEADTNVFVPMVMGIRRHVVALYDGVLKDQDITLNIPLGKEGRVAFHDLPYHPLGIRKPYLLISMELGKDGYLALPRSPEWVEAGGYYRIAPLPTQFSGDLEGVTFSMYGSVQSNTLYSLPYAVRMVDEVESLDGDGLILWDGAQSGHLYPPVDGDIIGIDYVAADDITIAGSRGEVVHFDGIHWTPAGVAPGQAEFTVMTRDESGGLWFGGSDGRVWHFDGLAWHTIETGYPVAVRDVWAAQGQAVVLYPGMGMVVNDFGVVDSFGSPAGYLLERVWGADFEDLYIVTSPPALWNHTPTGYAPVETVADVDLVDLDGSGPDEFFVLANPGTLLRYTDGVYEVIPVAPYEQFSSLRVLGPGNVLVGGADGVIHHVVGTSVESVQTDTMQAFFALDQGADGTLAAAGAQAYHLGPFMAYPRVFQPAADQFFDFSTIEWDYWSEGAQADYHLLILSSKNGYSFWSLVVDGETTSVALPPIVQELGLNVIPDGGKRLNLTAAITPGFNINHYTLNDFSSYDRVSWAVDLVNFE